MDVGEWDGGGDDILENAALPPKAEPRKRRRRRCRRPFAPLVDYIAAASSPLRLPALNRHLPTRSACPPGSAADVEKSAHARTRSTWARFYARGRAGRARRFEHHRWRTFAQTWGGVFLDGVVSLAAKGERRSLARRRRVLVVVTGCALQEHPRQGGKREAETVRSRWETPATVRSMARHCPGAARGSM